MSDNPYAAPRDSFSGAGPGVLRYRPANTLVWCLTCALFGVAACALVGALLSLAEIVWVDDIGLAMEVGESTGMAVAAGYLITGLFYVVVYLASVVLFCVWVFRANKNARALGADGMQYSPGWCVGWFFIPIANLFKPFLAVKEVYRASDPQAVGESWWQSDVPARFGWWWAAWIAANIVGRAETRMSLSDDPQLVEASTYVSFIGAPLTMIACLMCIWIVRSIHDRQQQKAESQQSGTSTNPWPTRL